MIKEVDVSGAFNTVANQSPLVAFMLLVLVVLLIAVSALWKRHVKISDETIKFLADISSGLRAMEKALDLLGSKLEVLLYDKRK